MPALPHRRPARAGQRDLSWPTVHWQIHAAPGHDPHSVILFEPRSRTLISADALWENGFGVVFPELEGEQAFDEVADDAGSDRVAGAACRDSRPRKGLHACRAVAGSGAPAGSTDSCATRCKHAAHAAKVLLKFKLLELQRLQPGGILRNGQAPRPISAWCTSAGFPSSTCRRWIGSWPKTWCARGARAALKASISAERLKTSVSRKRQKAQHFCWAFCGCKSLTMSYFHTGIRTIIGAEAFHCPVRDGKEWDHLAMVIRHNLLSC